MTAILRYNPWSVAREIRDEVSQFFDRNLYEKGACQWSPHVDIAEEADKYRVIADLPGIMPSDIKLTVEENVMTIQGERKSECKKEKDGYSRMERFTGNFKRQFTLPENIDLKSINAKSKHGVLEITLPKKEPASPKSMEVKILEES